MQDDRHTSADEKELIENPAEKAVREAENGVLQFDLVLAMVQEAIGKPFRLKARTINELQEAALQGIHHLAGTYRNTPVKIKGSGHSPPHHLDIPDEVLSLCAYVNEHWEASTALHLAAYILWKLNWIHPYADGNGRTARAVSYLVLSVKIGSLLPGTPTIPEQISFDKGPYYDGLEAADRSLDNNDDVDVSVLEQMLERMLVKQLLNRPSLSDIAQSKLSKVINDRIKKAPKETLITAFGSEDVKEQLWSIGDHLILQLSPKAQIDEAEIRQHECGDPFPHLLAVGDAVAKTRIDTLENYYRVEPHEIDIQDLAYAFSLQRDATCVLGRVDVKFRGELKGRDWTHRGVLYIVRFGSDIDAESFPSAFDLMLAKHLARVREAHAY